MNLEHTSLLRDCVMGGQWKLIAVVISVESINYHLATERND